MPTPRLFHAQPLAEVPGSGHEIGLGASAARHAQVLRLQPGDSVTLFDGWGGEYTAQIAQITRRGVTVQVCAHHAIEREAQREVGLAVCCPAGDRMDWLVEKATELGVAEIFPLLSERVVLRLGGRRAELRREHWHNVAIAACEQSGRNRIPTVHPLCALDVFLQNWREGQKWLLSLNEPVGHLAQLAQQGARGATTTVLCGPEGGFTPAEQGAATAAGFAPCTLANRTLRSETAALVALTLLV